MQKEAYVVQSDRHKLFLKFDTDTPAWPRLAAIGATPPLLAMGTAGGRSYIIQTFVDGKHPDRDWFASHLALLARFMRSYHDDEPLQEIVTPARAEPYAAHVRREVVGLERALADETSGIFVSADFRYLFQRFKAQAERLQTVPLLPVHPDPSPANILVTETGLTMIDWDDVLLSDPLRDVGLVLWWYLAPRLWPAFCDQAGTALDRDRIFWWVARRSLEVALWFAARGAPAPARAFCDDFCRAVQQQPNPQVVA
jgi:Ser/Thr protein kinase RdoA (MazF antagonist)